MKRKTKPARTRFGIHPERSKEQDTIAAQAAEIKYLSGQLSVYQKTLYAKNDQQDNQIESKRRAEDEAIINKFCCITDRCSLPVNMMAMAGLYDADIYRHDMWGMSIKDLMRLSMALRRMQELIMVMHRMQAASG